MNPNIENNFTHHPPKEGQPELYTYLREEFKRLAYIVDAHCPNSREKSMTFTKLEEAMFWANASIARSHPSSKGNSTLDMMNRAEQVKKVDQANRRREQRLHEMSNVRR